MRKGRPFTPGDARINRRGRPAVPDCLTDCLREVAEQPAPAGKTKAQALAAVLWRKALAGDLRAAALILDRLEGRPFQSVSIQVPSEPLSISEMVARMSAAEAKGDRQP